jgi:alanine racemase
LRTSISDLVLQRPTWAEIDLDSLRSNLVEIKRRCGHARILAVVKADAYGHGAVVIARELEAAGIGSFGVATVDEAAELRDAGIRTPILVLGGMTREQLPLLQQYGFLPTVYTRGFYEAAADFAVRRGEVIPVHFKVDTGMGRLGFRPQDALDILRHPRSSVRVEGLFTHFATADLLDDEFTLGQIRKFNEFLSQAGGYLPDVHAANSAAILNYPESHYNVVRPGLLLYGIAPFERELSAFRPVLSLKSKIIFLKEVKKGETIGYGRTFRAGRESLIATLPIGYTDGLRRAFSNRLWVEVRGKRCPIAGNVSMDLCMVDVTEVAGEVRPFDTVTFLGDGITAWEWAKLLDTLPYEIICLIGARVPRVYYKNNEIVDVYYP